MKYQKMVKTAKALNKAFKILQRLMVICGVVEVLIVGIFTVTAFVNPDFPIGTGPNTVSIGSLTFTLGEGAIPDNRTVLTYAWIIAVAAAAFVLM